MNIIIWFGFFLSLGLLLIIARKNLWLGLIISAYTLGIFSLSFFELWKHTVSTFTDPSILLLALSVGLIPQIGGTMELGGLTEDLVNNLKMKPKSFIAFTPAFFGMLPIPGGALLSAPLIDHSSDKISNKLKSAVNIWFRHVFLLIYPLGILLATTKMANLNLYTIALYLIPGFLLMSVLGYFILLRNIDNKTEKQKQVNSRKLLIPVFVIVIAPIVHLLGIVFFKDVIQEIPLLIGVSLSLCFATLATKLNLSDMKKIALKMKPWNFALIIMGMFLFLNIFKASETSRVIAEASFSKTFLTVGIGFLLGFTTGRVQVPISIILPIYLVQFGPNTMTPVAFAIMFFAIYQGYIISPVHPCVAVTLTYFNTDLKEMYKLLSIPALTCLAVAWIVSGILF